MFSICVFLNFEKIFLKIYSEFLFNYFEIELNVTDINPKFSKKFSKFFSNIRKILFKIYFKFPINFIQDLSKIPPKFS